LHIKAQTSKKAKAHYVSQNAIRKFEFWNLIFGTWNLELETWNLIFGIWNLDFGI
jgi:hypothetical protein